MSEIPKTGETLGNYTLLKHMGASLSGASFAAQETGRDTYAVVKWIHPRNLAGRGAASAETLAARMTTMTGATNPHNATVHACRITSESGWVAREMLRGQALSHTLRKKTQVSNDALVRTANSLISGLRYLWKQHGFIHGNLNPNNIIGENDGDEKLTDFGLGLNILPTPVQSLPTVYPFAYCAPEPKTAEADCRTDIFALGAILYELAAGARAFPQTTAAAIQEAKTNRAFISIYDVNPNLPPEILTLIEAMLEPNLGDRVADYDEIAAALQIDIANDVKRVPCPHCSGQLSLDAELIGTAVTCPFCKKPFTVPNFLTCALIPKVAAKPMPAAAPHIRQAGGRAAGTAAHHGNLDFLHTDYGVSKRAMTSLATSHYSQYGVAAVLLKSRIAMVRKGVVTPDRTSNVSTAHKGRVGTFEKFIQGRAKLHLDVTVAVLAAVKDELAPALGEGDPRSMIAPVESIGALLDKLTACHKSLAQHPVPREPLRRDVSRVVSNLLPAALAKNALPPEQMYDELKRIVLGWTPYCLDALEALATALSVYSERPADASPPTMDVSLAPPSLLRFCRFAGATGIGFKGRSWSEI